MSCPILLILKLLHLFYILYIHMSFIICISGRISGMKSVWVRESRLRIPFHVQPQSVHRTLNGYVFSNCVVVHFKDILTNQLGYSKCSNWLHIEFAGNERLVSQAHAHCHCKYDDCFVTGSECYYCKKSTVSHIPKFQLYSRGFLANLLYNRTPPSY
jgi:hypothetical protein